MPAPTPERLKAAALHAAAAAAFFFVLQHFGLGETMHDSIVYAALFAAAAALVSWSQSGRV
jgi:hypothetical protein